MSIVGILDKLDNVKNYVNKVVIEREAEIDSQILAILSGSSCLLIGDAGSAKTKGIKLLTSMMDLSFFDILISDSTKPESIFGPPDIPALAMENIQRNKIAGYAPTAEVIFFDEIFKASGIVLNPLLWLINERIYKNGDEGTINCPLITTFAASNEIPTDEAMRPIYDRFIIRHEVKYIKTTSNLNRLFASVTSEPPKKPEKMTRTEVERLRRATANVSISSEIWERIVKIRDQVQIATSVVISDRRLVSTINVARAHALLNRRAFVDLPDLEIIASLFWDQLEQIRKVRGIVVSNTGSMSADLASYEEQAEKVFDHAMKTGDLKGGLTKLKDILITTKQFSTHHGTTIHRAVFEHAKKLHGLIQQRKIFNVSILKDEHNKPWYKLSEASSQIWTKDQLRSVGFSWKRTMGYWYVKAEKRKTEEQIRKIIVKKLGVVPIFTRLI